MTTSPLIPHGLHHVTAVTANARANLDFYTRVLGLRLVKKTVNQDDVSAYHLFFADGAGSPGSDLTFFEWPVPPETRGNNSITRTGLRVPEGSLEWWAEHLRGQGLEVTPVTRAGRAHLDFADPEGQRLSLLEGGPAGVPWEGSTVPAEHQILGLGPTELTLPGLFPTERVLTRVYGLGAAGTYPDPEDSSRTIHVYAMGEGGPHAELHLRVDPSLPPARSGAGGVHHLALRVRDEDYHAWAEHLAGLGLRTSGEVDRHWFHSVYYREPQGILIELATDGPGFAVDEDPAHLGETLVLAPFLEPRRAQIEAGLTPLS
ncbi:ring-cleaving dioxygenase [Deinococcus sp. SDU3-2]|uniref:Ring-cleaving dioxygenase n=1 Tax=Deinococcus terrestris TaxID=2651870 RepID=A0A7X1NTQ6_9DEIO|nr:ring-cleaving dioxygenase [Deinococcus terrestris]MPY65463.1 ring-cleaving dioxygenase [Deinococcus terrestris]